MEPSTGRVVKVRLSVGFWILVVILSLISFGVWGLMFLWITRSWVKTLDDEGLTLRNGQRYLWKDLAYVDAVVVRHTSGIRLGGRIDLDFHGRKKAIRIVKFSTGNSEEVFDFLTAKVGHKVQV